MSNKWVAPPAPPAGDKAPPRRADHTVMRGQQLVAYLYVCEAPGAVLRASGKEMPKLAELPYGVEVRCYAKAHEAAVQALAAAATELDALLFKLGLEGFDVHPGQLSADAARRRL